eukprot:gene12635-16942_t
MKKVTSVLMALIFCCFSQISLCFSSFNQVEFTQSSLLSRIKSSNLILHANKIPRSPLEDMKTDIKRTISAISTTSLAAILFSLSNPKQALAQSVEKANEKLADYGLPPFIFIPPGFNPLVSELGRGNIREKMVNPILVQMVYPQLWVVKETSVNNNGESGTISANDYIKGDSAFLFISTLKSGDSLSVNAKDLIYKFLLKSVTQKGDLVDNLRIYNISPGPVGLNGQQYVIVDFTYSLNTEAGFIINRNAVASITSVGSGENNLQGLISATTDKRWKKNNLEGTLREIARSFRVYKLNSGIFATDS